MREYKYNIEKPEEFRKIFNLNADLSYQPVGIIVDSIDHQVDKEISSVELVPSLNDREYQVSDKLLREMYNDGIISLKSEYELSNSFLSR